MEKEEPQWNLQIDKYVATHSWSKVNPIYILCMHSVYFHLSVWEWLFWMPDNCMCKNQLFHLDMNMIFAKDVVGDMDK